jgi:hypothetical protein
MTRNDSITGVLLLFHSKILAAVAHKSVDLFEGSLVKQKLYSLARRELPLTVLTRNPLRPASGRCLTILIPQYLVSVSDHLVTPVDSILIHSSQSEWKWWRPFSRSGE